MAKHEDEIRDVLIQWAQAIISRDLEGLMALYADDVIYFDSKPPFQTNGKEAVRAIWHDNFPYFPTECSLGLRDFTVFGEGDVAFAHCLLHFGGDKNSPASQTWVRATSGYRRLNGRWQIAHEHLSLPFDAMTGMVVLSKDP